MGNPIRISIFGGLGRMGRALFFEARNNPRFEICQIIEHEPTMASFEGVDVCETPAVVPDVFVDFTTAGATGKNCRRASERYTPFVTGTTALLPVDTKQLELSSKSVCVLADTNMSLGISCLKSLLNNMQGLLAEGFDAEMIEKHHRHKLDAPSGTAHSLAACLKGLKPIYGREGRAEKQPGEIGIHAVRAGGIPGEHSVIFSSESEMIEIKHSLINRSALAAGTLCAVEFAISSPAGLYTMADVWENLQKSK